MPSILYGFTESEISTFPGIILEAKPEGASEVSDHPVETGNTISDHATVKPDRISLSVHISPVVLSGTAGNPREALALVQRIQTERVLCTINLDIGTWEDVILVQWVGPRTRDVGTSIVLELDFQRIRLVETRTTAMVPILRRRQHRGATSTTATPAQRDTLARSLMNSARGPLAGLGGDLTALFR